MEDYKYCPYCHGELKKGIFLSRGCNAFLPEHVKRPLFYSVNRLSKQGAVCLPPDPCGATLKVEHPIAYHCPKCQAIIIPYE